MRKISSHASEEKKKRRNQFIIGGVLVLVLILSTLGFSLQSSSQNNANTNPENEDGLRVTYNGLEFLFNTQYSKWLTSQRGFTLAFTFPPTQVDKDLGENLTFNIENGPNYFDDYQRKPLYISSNNSVVTNEVLVNLAQLSSRTPQQACLNEEGCPEDYPIKTCEDNFIIVQEDTTPSITQQQNCVFIKGEKKDLIKITDAFLLKIFEIN